MNASEIATAVAYRHTWNPATHIIIPNVCDALGEMDLAVVTKSLWMQEVEIKVSLSDFKREFTHKASKHRMLVNGRPKRIPYMRRNIDTPQLIHHTIKHFWFASPLPLAERILRDEILPAHAGLLGITQCEYWASNYTVKVLVEAPRLRMARKLTMDEYADLLRKAYLRYWDTRGKDYIRHEEPVLDFGEVA